MFLVFSKEKIQTYLVSILTVAVLIGIANIDSIKTIPTLSTEKYLPIYNVEKYLERCIKSIIKQTYKKIF